MRSFWSAFAFERATPKWSLFLSLLMHRILFAPFTILLKLDFTGDQLLILAGPIIDALAGIAGQFNESIL